MNKRTTTQGFPDDGFVTPATTPEVKETKQPKAQPREQEVLNLEFDIEGLMSDFPTATELQKFVYDRTNVVLDLKGRSNKLKYQIALDVLNGKAPPVEVLGAENPYIDKSDVIFEEPMKQVPPAPERVRGHIPVITYQSNIFPHPDPEWKANGQKCQVLFRKYLDNTITYEILGPIAQKAIGTRINKFGQSVPEKYVWIDPREGEQIIRDHNGMLTPIGTRLKGFMSKQKVGKSDQWATWIDRDFMIGTAETQVLDNPWGK